MERDSDYLWLEDNEGISTHTLTWSVTFKLDSNGYIKVISTHTPTWSVTR